MTTFTGNTPSNLSALVEQNPETASNRESVDAALQEGVDSARFIPVEYKNGYKKPTITGWQNLPQRKAANINGPAGIVCGDGLVVVDDDSHKPGVELPSEFEELPETFTVDTLHGGTHRYYCVDGDQPKSSRPQWGDIQSAGDMVVAPGTVFSHESCRDDCPFTGEGRYEVVNDAPIATIDPADFPTIFGTNVGEEDTSTNETPEAEFDGDIDRRLTFAINHDPKFADLWQWAKRGGQPPLDFDDRSAAETALAQKLMLYLQWDEAKTRRVLDQLRPPKWTKREDASYRDSVIKAARKYTRGKGEKFEPNGGSGESGVCYEQVVCVVYYLFGREKVRTKEIVQKDDVNIGEKQVQKVFNTLEESGYVHYERHGRYGYWVIDTVPDPQGHSEFCDQFLSREEVRDQRRSFLSY